VSRKGILQLETFTQTREFVDDPSYDKRRGEYLRKLDLHTIDTPIAKLIRDISQLPYCFSLQSCYGHFLHDNQKDPKNIEPLPISTSILSVEYRIAYIALCIQDNDSGRTLFDDLRKIPGIDPEYIQSGCAEWFWNIQVNSYVLQVEPIRFMDKDSVSINYEEALHIEKIRNEFFGVLKTLFHQKLENSIMR